MEKSNILDNHTGKFEESIVIEINNKDTLGVWIRLPEEMQAIYKGKYDTDDAGMDCVWGEYHKDDNTFFYCFLSSNNSDIYDVTEDFAKLNNFVRNLSKKVDIVLI